VYIVDMSEYFRVMCKYEIFYVFPNSIEPIYYYNNIFYYTIYYSGATRFSRGRGPYLLELYETFFIYTIWVVYPQIIGMVQEEETVLNPTLVMQAGPTAKLNQLLFSTKIYQLYIYILFYDVPHCKSLTLE